MKHPSFRPSFMDVMPKVARHLVVTDAAMAYDDSKIEDAKALTLVERFRGPGNYGALHRRHMPTSHPVASKMLYMAFALRMFYLITIICCALLLALVGFLPLLASILF